MPDETGAAVLKCYDFWLAATFGDDPNVLMSIKKDLDGLGIRILPNEIEWGKSTIDGESSKYPHHSYHNAKYDHWFSIYLASGRLKNNPGTLMFLSNKDLSHFGTFIPDSAKVVTRLFLELRELEHLTRYEKETRGHYLHHIRGKVAILRPFLGSILPTLEARKATSWLLDEIDNGIGLEFLESATRKAPPEIYDSYESRSIFSSRT